MMDNIMIMDETMVSYHTPRTKKTFKTVDQEGPARSHQGKSPFRPYEAFAVGKGLIYTHIVPRGTRINTNYIVKALGNFMKYLRKMRPVMVTQRCFFDWINASIHTAAVMKMWLAANNIQLFQPHSY